MTATKKGREWAAPLGTLAGPLAALAAGSAHPCGATTALVAMLPLGSVSL